MRELSRTHDWPVRLSLIVILSRYDVLGTIDVNLNELQYLAAHLNSFECRRLIAALHYTTYELPSNLADAGKPISDCNNDNICPSDRRNIDRKISWKLKIKKPRVVGQLEFDRFQFQLIFPLYSSGFQISFQIPRSSSFSEFESNDYSNTLDIPAFVVFQSTMFIVCT